MTDLDWILLLWSHKNWCANSDLFVVVVVALLPWMQSLSMQMKIKIFPSFYFEKILICSFTKKRHYLREELTQRYCVYRYFFLFYFFLVYNDNRRGQKFCVWIKKSSTNRHTKRIHVDVFGEWMCVRIWWKRRGIMMEKLSLLFILLKRIWKRECAGSRFERWILVVKSITGKNSIYVCGNLRSTVFDSFTNNFKILRFI